MITTLLAAALTFTATANGLESGASVEFIFTGKDSDRDYETLFTLDKSVNELCRDLEKAGLKRGRSTDPRKCVLWPEGCEVSLKPALSELVTIEMPDGYSMAPFIYTGGARDDQGKLRAAEDQPLAFMALYTLSQAPIQLNGSYPQGDVYSAFRVKKTFKKGDKIEFTLAWKDDDAPRSLAVEFKPGTMMEGVKDIRNAATNGEVSVQVSFSPDLTVGEATQVAKALSLVDSAAVKINGVKSGDFFYQTFLPQIKWTDRQQRMLQPFEIRFDAKDQMQLTYIEEDWSAPGDDPKLTPRQITLDEAAKYTKTDTAFIFCAADTKLGKLQTLKQRFPLFVINWYVYIQ